MILSRFPITALAVLALLTTFVSGCRGVDEIQLEFDVPHSAPANPGFSTAVSAPPIGTTIVGGLTVPRTLFTSTQFTTDRNEIAIAPLALTAVAEAESCVVRVNSAPAFRRDGLPYRQGITPATLDSGAATINYDSIDTGTLLRQYLTGDDVTAEDFRRSNRLRSGWRGQRDLRLINVHHAYARGATGAGVRIAIQDSAVDILSWDFRGRISYAGARLTLRQDYVHDPAYAKQGFGHCRTAADAKASNCAVWEINAGGNRDLIAQYARQIIEAWDFPNRENSWWIRDTGESGQNAWYEIPALFDTRTYTWGNENYVPSVGYDHGTQIASIAAGWTYGVAPGAQIVPLTYELTDEADRALNRNFPVIYLDDANNNFLRNLSHLTATQRVALDQELASSYSELYTHFDIVNRSYTADVSPHETGAFVMEEVFARYLPNYWRALQQLDTPAADRVIEVQAAGNDGNGNDQLLRSSPNNQPARPYYYPAFRGHHIAVMAVDSNGGAATYSNRCGGLPPDWNIARDGRHYCVAAPGNLYGIGSGWRGGSLQQALSIRAGGTSNSAPVVSGALALIMSYFTDTNGVRQLGNREIALRLINTADNTGRYSDLETYGAGLIDLEAAIRPVGTSSVGNATTSAPVHTSYAALPYAYGDVADRLQGVHIATFDEWNAPFFRSADSFLTQSKPNVMVVPTTRFRTNATPDLAAQALRLTRSVSALPTQQLAVVSNGTGLGFVWPAHDRIEFGALLDHSTDQGAEVSGAFGNRVESGIIWSQLRYRTDISRQWSGWATFSLGAGKPDYKNSMLEIGAAAFSAWEIGIERRRLMVKLGQPWRAESGRGVLHYTSGRDRTTGRHWYARQSFSLAPTGRELRLTAQSNVPIPLGEVAMELGAQYDANHRDGKSEAHVGISWQLRW